MSNIGPRPVHTFPRRSTLATVRTALLARATSLPVLVAVTVTGSFLVSPAPAAMVASASCGLAVLGSLALAPADRADQLQTRGPDRGAWWPTTLRALLVGLLLTLAALGASRSVLLGSWEPLVVGAVLVASVVPWWLGPAQDISRCAVQRRPAPAGDTAVDDEAMLWHRRRRVDTATLAFTVGVTGTLLVVALLVTIAEGTAEESLGGGHLVWMRPGGLTSAALAPLAATIGAMAGTAATVAAARSGHVRPTPNTHPRLLIVWAACGAILVAGCLGLWAIR